MGACAFCGEYSSSSHLGHLGCSRCHDQLSELQLSSQCEGSRFLIGSREFPGQSVWAYRGLVREIILQFKIQRRWAPGRALMRRALVEPDLEALLADIHAVMPVPSSFWGRIRGRFDLAAAFAFLLSQEFQKPMLSPPWSLWGNLTKQAMIPRAERVPKVVGLSRQKIWDERFVFRALGALPAGEMPRVLVVDDVVTSAHTLTEFINRFRNIDFRVLTLASAARSNNHTDSEIQHESPFSRRTAAAHPDGSAIFRA